MTIPGQVDVIYTDFAKAFDTVLNRYLLHTLVCFWFNGNVLSWFTSSCLFRRILLCMELCNLGGSPDKRETGRYFSTQCLSLLSCTGTTFALGHSFATLPSAGDLFIYAQKRNFNLLRDTLSGPHCFTGIEIQGILKTSSSVNVNSDYTNC